MRTFFRPSKLVRFAVHFLFILGAVHQPSMAAAAQPGSHIDDEVKAFVANGPAVESKLIALEAGSGHKIIVMTRRSLGKAATLKELGSQQFRALKLGKNDALFLFVHNENKIRVESGAGVSDILNDPLVLRSIYDAVVKKFDFEDDGLGLARGVDAMILALRPGLISSLIKPRTIPWALLSLALSAALIFAAYLGIKKLRQPN